MNRPLTPGWGIVLASLLCVWATSLGAAARAAAPVVTVLGLRVNGFNTTCGATVGSGARVCVRFNSEQAGFAVVTVTKGTSTEITDSGNVIAGTNYLSCVTAGTADDVVRTITVKVTNAAKETGMGTCNYKVSITPSVLPMVTVLGLRVNGFDTTCGATVGTGARVCVRFQSDQDAFATVFVTKGASTRAIASGNVLAGKVYTACVTAGTADDVVRTLTVQVANVNGTGAGTCNYKVSITPSVLPSVTILGIRVNGAEATCNASVKSGDRVCVAFVSDQHAFAAVTVTKGTIVTPIASGNVLAGTLYTACFTAGAGDNVVRTITVKVSNTNGTGSATCDYKVVP